MPRKIDITIEGREQLQEILNHLVKDPNDMAFIDNIQIVLRKTEDSSSGERLEIFEIRRYK